MKKFKIIKLMIPSLMLVGLISCSESISAKPLEEFVRCSSVDVNEAAVEKLKKDISIVCSKIERSKFVSDDDFLVSFTKIGRVLNGYNRIRNNLKAKSFVIKKLKYLLSRKFFLCEKLFGMICRTKSTDIEMFNPISRFLGEEQFKDIFTSIISAKKFIFSDFVEIESPVIDFDDR